MRLRHSVTRRRLPGGPLLSAIIIVFLLQLALMSWLSDDLATAPDSAPKAPAFQLAEPNQIHPLLFEDPTLFVLPRRESFSGGVWMTPEEQPFEPESWTEAPRLLELAPRDLGTAFVEFVRNDALPDVERTPLFEPPFILPPLLPTLPIPLPGALRVEGDLAARPLLVTPDLPALPGSDLLTNSIVQVTVDTRGRVFSAVLRDRAVAPESPHQAAADSNALRIAQQLRFAPDIQQTEGADPLFPELTVGTLVFQWQTAPTNAAPAISGS